MTAAAQVVTYDAMRYAVTYYTAEQNGLEQPWRGAVCGSDMRARIIKPGFYSNEQLAECSVLARLIFPGLWMMADRRGRIEDRPKRIKAALLPYDDADIDSLLNELADNGLVARYESGGKRVIQVTEFEKHQRCHVREPESDLPAPNGAVPRHNLGSASHAPRHDLGECEASPICPEAEAEADTEAEAERGNARARAAPLEAPTEAHEQLAREVGVSCQAEFEKYRDWLATNGKAHRNRDAGFRNWLRRAGEFKARDAPRMSVHDKRTATARAMYGDTHARQPADITADSERVA